MKIVAFKPRDISKEIFLVSDTPWCSGPFVSFCNNCYFGKIASSSCTKVIFENMNNPLIVATFSVSEQFNYYYATHIINVNKFWQNIKTKKDVAIAITKTIRSSYLTIKEK